MDKWLETFADSGFRRSSDVAHDLKTPLNVAVLNLELLRMRVAKISNGEVDEKTSGYLRGIDVELRRMARIFDAFFVNASPPRDNPPTEDVDFTALLRPELEQAGIDSAPLGRSMMLNAHPARLREAARLIGEALPKIFKPGTAVVHEAAETETYRLWIEGSTELDESAMGKLFKFYYTDPFGLPDLAMATARLILETYGSALELKQDTESLVIELTLAVGDQ